jgi:Domain of unknown function (DUF4249)
MNKLILTLLLAVLLTACEKEYVLTTNETEAKVVIEGLITNRAGYGYIKVTRSAGFYETGKTPRITDAMVTISDDLGNVTEFVHNPRENPDSTGYYKPVTPFLGEIGRTYHLTVQADGNVYEATDKMYPVTTIDSLSYQINDDELSDPKYPGRYFEVLIYTHEPRETKDYYLFNFYRNDSLKLDNPTDIYFSDDVALAESIDGITTPIFYSKGDMATVEAFSLSRGGFVFYNDLSILLNNDGGMYSPPPANCRTNLTNGALGFFQVSAVNSMEVPIE